MTTEGLWAPWRLEYIKRTDEAGCFLCRILESDDDRTNLVLKRGRHGVILMNRYPYNNGHLLICPYRHVADVGLMNADEKLEMMELLAESIDVLKSTVRPDGFNAGINLGNAAGAGLEEHVHMHVVPRWNGDTNFMPVLADIKVIPQALLELWDELKAAL